MKSIGTALACLACAGALQAAAAAGAAAAAARGPPLPGEPAPEGDALVQWIVANGGEANVAVRRLPGVGRATFALRAFEPGDVMARVPVELCYRPQGSLQALQASSVKLLADMSAPDSPWAPYFRSLPGRDGVRSFYELPRSYAPLIQDAATEAAIFSAQDWLAALWQDRRGELAKQLGRDASAADLAYGMSLLLTRLYQFENETLLLVPLLDCANHATGCVHSHEPAPCDPAAGEGLVPLDPHAGAGAGAAAQLSGQCIVWRAQEPVAAGAEVCNAYKFVLQDRAVLQYGFLLPDWVAHELSVLDRPDFDPEHPWGDPPGVANIKHGPPRFEGSAEQLRAEVARLARRVAELDAGEAAAAAVAPDAAADPDGSWLAMLRAWRGQRRDAMAREMRRLQAQAARLQAAADTAGGGGAGAFAAAAAALTAWLEGEGAQVNVELRHDPPAPDAAAAEAAGTCSAAEAGGGSCAAQPQPQPGASPPAVGVFARRPVRAGQVLASLPLAVTLPVADGSDRLLTAVRLMLLRHAALSDAANRTSSSSGDGGAAAAELQQLEAAAARLRPYLAALPPLGSVTSLFNLPPEYLPLLGQPDAEAYVAALQRALAEAWAHERGAIEGLDASLSFAELQHAMSLVQTRTLAVGERMLLAPLATAARHNASCRHTYRVVPCPGGGASSSGDDGMCLEWLAGEDVAAGQEVCTTFGWLLPDQAVLVHGLSLQQLAAAQPQPGDGSSSGSSGSTLPHAVLQVGALDRPGVDPEAPFGEFLHEPPPPLAPEDRAQALALIAHLAATHLELASPQADEAAAALQPVPRDAGGALLGRLLAWRESRVAVLEAEIERLGESWDIADDELLAAIEAEQAARDARGAATAGGDRWARLLAWLHDAGAVINVDIADTGGPAGRVLVARRAMVSGDLLAAIPAHTWWSVTHQGGNGSLNLAAANLWAEMTDPRSPRAPYFASLPSRDELVCPLVAMPPAYRPLLQSAVAERAVSEHQAKLDAFWAEHGADMAATVPGMTLGDLRYARSLLATRLFSTGAETGSAAVPLMDLANHDHDCRHGYHTGPCPGNSDALCLLWVAGTYLEPGQEVCNAYRFMTNDRAMLQYGFLQAGPIAAQLHTLDDGGFNETNLWQLHQFTLHGPPLSNGTHEQVAAELARLRGVAAAVAAGDAAAAATQPDPGDVGGRMLALLLEWRQQRKDVLGAEIARLEALLAGAAPPPPPPEQALLDWLQQHGGQVAGVRVGAAEAAPDAGRGVFVTRRFTAGEVIAAVPLDLGFALNLNNLLVDAPSLWADLRHPRSPRAAWWALQPGRAGVASFHNLPLSYAPLIQHEPTAAFLADLADRLSAFAGDASNAALMERAGMGLADLPHLLSLVSTRVLQFARHGGHLLPLLDLPNHANDCPHRLDIGDCAAVAPGAGGARDGEGPRTCVALLAGAELAPGSEVCLKYGYLAPDRAALQYGFVLPGGGLSSIDRHDFEAEAAEQLPWQFRLEHEHAAPPFEGSPEQLRAEVARLEQREAELDAGDAAAAAVEPAPGDEGGAMLAMLRAWRRGRKAGVAAELQRLRRLLADAAEPGAS